MSAQEMGSLDIQARLRRSVVNAIKACPLSRWEIAGQMSNLVDAEITPHMLNAWTAESKEWHRFPAEYLPAFCRVVGSYDPLQILVDASPMFLVPGEDAVGAELAKKIQQREDLNQQIREMRVLLKGFRQ